MVEPPSIEVQIDCFLEQFKLSASRVMEEGSNMIRSRSAYLDGDLPDELERAIFENGVDPDQDQDRARGPARANHDHQAGQQQQQQLAGPTLALLPSPQIRVCDIPDLLYAQYAVITGGKSREGFPIITFPDRTDFHLLPDLECQQVMVYLTAVPSMQEADMGFQLIVDRRKDKWTSVKTVLLKISMLFPGLIHVVYVIRPVNIFQKAISEVSSKLFKDEFKFRMIVLSTAEELHQFVDANQLTADLGGSLVYSHEEWIQNRVNLENFNRTTDEISQSLADFSRCINETEYPNTPGSVKDLLDTQAVSYNLLKEDIAAATVHGEGLLQAVRGRNGTTTTVKDTTIAEVNDSSPVVLRTVEGYALGYICGIESLLLQLEETESTFEAYWVDHTRSLNHVMEMRLFEQEFREMQNVMEGRMKDIHAMDPATTPLTSVATIDARLDEVRVFAGLVDADMELIETLVATGHRLLLFQMAKNDCPHECVMPKCEELARVKTEMVARIEGVMDGLCKCRMVMVRIDEADTWCAKGLQLLSDLDAVLDKITREHAERAFGAIEAFLASHTDISINRGNDYHTVLYDSIHPNTKSKLSEVCERIEDVFAKCEKKMETLRRLATRPPPPPPPTAPHDAAASGPSAGGSVCGAQPQSQPPHAAQPTGGAPHPVLKKPLKKAASLKMESGGGISEDNGIVDNDAYQAELRRAKQGHVLSELLETERTYVGELRSIIAGYKNLATSPHMQDRIPAGLADNVDTLFGNIDDIYNFHSEVFLKDLENCISSADLVALCFVQKRETFFRLYSYYCQNIPRSEQLREQLNDAHLFFPECQRKLDHKLPLGAYLLKPVQRITKYQLLLKDLLRYTDESSGGQYRTELQQALDCMLQVLKYVNDSMLQISIIGFPVDLSQQGELLLQGTFHLVSESKKDLRLRLKPKQRHLFLYQKMILFCKQADKQTRAKTTYHFKHHLQMSQIGLTESVRGDARKFEVWLQGRQEVHTLQASNVEQKNTWVNEIKRVLFNQLEELKGEQSKQYIALNKQLAWEMRTGPAAGPSQLQPPAQHPALAQARTMSLDTARTAHHHMNNSHAAAAPAQHHPPHHLEHHRSTVESAHQHHQQQQQQQQTAPPPLDEDLHTDWSSDCSNSDDDDALANHATPSGPFVALADYCAVGNGEVSIWEGDVVDLQKVGCAGWWFVKVSGSNEEGWAPAAYLEKVQRKSSQSGSSSQDGLDTKQGPSLKDDHGRS